MRPLVSGWFSPRREGGIPQSLESDAPRETDTNSTNWREFTSNFPEPNSRKSPKFVNTKI
jgi:hypothetical protein